MGISRTFQGIDLVAVAAGKVAGMSIVQKFGRNPSVGTTFVPVSVGGIFRTPQAGSPVQLRVKAGGNANDTLLGTGARRVRMIGIDANGDELTQTVALAGASASTATTQSFIRLHRAFVSESGTYATQSAGSHSADIVIEDSAGSQDWATISSTGFPRAQTEILAYTIPNGYKGYILGAELHTDTTKITDALMFQRTSVLDTAAPYDAMRLLHEEVLSGGHSPVDYRAAQELVGPCDVGFLCKVNTGTAQVNGKFELLLIED